MPDVPRYPTEETSSEHYPQVRPPTSWRTYVLVAGGVALLVLLVVLHLTGVLGPGEH